MTIRTAEQAAEAARNTKTNVPDTCQLVTRGYYLAPSAGDRDGDGDADAIDGWLSEPKTARVPLDRKPPLGFPVAFKNRDGSGHGHRAISLGDANRDGVFLIRSTDFDTTTKRYRAGVVGTGTIAEIERAMNLTYLGWTKTITGIAIPSSVPPPAKTTAPSPDAHVIELVQGLKGVLGQADALLSVIQKTGSPHWAPRADKAHDLLDDLVDGLFNT